MKFLNLVTLSLTALSSFVSADYYHASRITYYGGSGDEDSVKDPFCQDYSSNVDKYLRGMDYYVALSADVLSKSNASSYCGKKIKLNNNENGRSLTATVVDKCRSCGYGNVDLSVKAFKYLSDDHMSKGVLKQVEWCIVDGPSKFACPSSGSSSNKTSSKKKSSTKTSTKKTTTTKKSSTKKTSSSSSSSSSKKKAGGIYVELEKGSRYGDVSKAYDLKYYSGSGYIYIDDAEGSSGTRSRVAAKVNLSSAGKYTIKVKYNNSKSSSRKNRIVINDSQVFSIKFSPTGSEWKKLTIENVQFKKGENIVQVRATDGKMSFDYIYIE